MNWYNIDIDKIFELTESSKNGISNSLAEEKLLEQGPNKLEEKKKKSAVLMLLNQFRDFMIIILLAAAIISGLIGGLLDTLFILVIVSLNAILGFIQEYKAEKAMEVLRKMASMNATVFREGKTEIIPAVNLVMGDIVLLESGNIVPADLRLFEVRQLRADESSLTGESFPSDKIANTLYEKNLSIGDQSNMIHKSAFVTSGRAKGIVVATGMNTEIGHIARLLDKKETATPLQIRMADFGRKISYLILFICALLFCIGMLRHENAANMFLLSISLAVAAIPEALPALITIALAMGAKRMVKIHVLIRKLYAVETLGSVNFICTDKTGTLTMNKMKVVNIIDNQIIDKVSTLTFLELGMMISHDVKSNQKNSWLGDPTEIAVVQYIEENKSEEFINQTQNQHGRITELPFDSDRKCMTTLHHYANLILVICKGAPETIANLLENTNERKALLEKSDELAKQGKRIIAYAYRILPQLPTDLNYKLIERNLIYCGLVGMLDPPRPEVKTAIEECKAAGIIPIMISGDHPETASAIARELGILEENSCNISGQELEKMSAETFYDQVERIRVYARVSPEQKLNIIKTLQKKNHFVAMTGDGVNDAPSLKAANIGISMGINGSDVSKEASHMILLDDNFASIVKAIKEGRRIYDNIRKFIKYIMSCNGAEISSIFLAPLLGLPIPLLPIHILWINLVTDGLPGLALASEKAEKNIMRLPPRKTNESLFSNGMPFHILWVGLLMAGVTLAAEAWAFQSHNNSWQTMVFTILTFSQIGHVLSIRSENEFLFEQGLLSNLPMFASVVITISIHLLVIYLPTANHIFKTTPLSLMELGICIGLSSIVFHAVELGKWIKPKIQNH